MFRHRFDPSSLVAAVVFLGIAWGYLAGGWSAAPSVVRGVLGALVVVAVLRRVFRSRHRDL
ncbi:hypothetical protein NE236_06760 [Actinoallomurus purpureus]|uniref:hypothetical protein n=1 Tax=Actinoallomurus purpureus TaxID=478114 RepID=UPI002092E7EB|nr:hypothetical protein [Actinoallomurus purpureus]MCO6004676.1 hypothetical protein [Actinoallomurus purpureus]